MPHALTSSTRLRTPVKPVKREATEFHQDELHSELGKYGIIPTGVAMTNITLLQHKLDEEYREATAEYELEVKRLEKAKLVLEKANRVEAEIDEEANALAENRKIRSYHSQIEQNTTTSDIRVLGLNPILARAIFRALHQNTSVLAIDLSRNDLSRVDTRCIAEMLEQNRSLLKLNLESTKLGSEIVSEISNALCTNVTLTFLSLENNPITAFTGMDLSLVATKSLSNMLTRNKSLTALNLCNTSIDVEGGKNIAAGVRLNETLFILDINNNSIGFKEMDIIANQLQENISYYQDQCKGKSEMMKLTSKLADKQLDEIRLQRMQKENEEWHARNKQERDLIRQAEEARRVEEKQRQVEQREAEIAAIEAERLRKIAEAEAKKAKKAAAKKKK